MLRFFGILWLTLISVASCGWAESTVVTVQNFEQSFAVGRWPDSVKIVCRYS